MYISEHSRHGVLLIHQILREYLFAFVCSLGVSFSASQALCWKGEQTVHSYLLWTDYLGPTDLCHIPSQSPLPIWEVCLPSHIPCRSHSGPWIIVGALKNDLTQRFQFRFRLTITGRRNRVEKKPKTVDIHDQQNLLCFTPEALSMHSSSVEAGHRSSLLT